MKKKKELFKNSILSFLSQIVTVAFTFITRNLFINYIGIEILGINGTFSSILGALSLAELGIQTSITYNLFKPLHDNNYEETNELMNIFKILYRYIGFFFIIVSFMSLPFLKYVLKGIQISASIYIWFLLQASASAISYFLAYGRSLLYADQKDHIAKIIDLIVTFTFNVAQCIFIIVYKNYYIFLLIKIFQVLISNFIISKYCKYNYSFLKDSQINKTVLKRILADIKNVFSGKIASYIYGSTDNLIISALVGTISVGFITNYTTITKNIRSLVQSALLPVLPFIGNYLVDEPDLENRKELFKLYSHIRYIIAMIIVIPFFVLCEDFVTFWIGKKMILKSNITVLLCIDLYIDLVHSSTLDFIYGSGMFRQERKIEIIGAIANLTLSIMLVKIYGIDGVLMGTVISQLVFWVGRSIIVFYNCLKLDNKDYFCYWIRNILYVCILVLSCFVCKKVYLYFVTPISILDFLIRGLVIETILVVMILLVFRKNPEQRFIIDYFLRWIKKNKRIA